MKLKKALSVIAASVIGAGAVLPMSGSIIAAETTARPLGTYEAEELDIGDQQIWTSIYDDKIPGYSGEGFVYLTTTEFSVDIEVEEEGIYEISARCAQILNADGRMQTISINGIDYTFTLPYYNEWTDVDLGVFRFKKGVNKIVFKPQYGYAAYDTITVKEAEMTELKNDPNPCDPDATAETKSLMSYLSSVYGKHVISGQQEIYGSGHKEETTIRYDADKNICVDSKGNTYTFSEDDKDVADDGSKFVWHCYDEAGHEYTYNSQNRNYVFVNYDYEMDYLYDLTGKYPAIRGFDFMNYNPLYGWNDGSTERVLDWVKNKNGIATVCWHINIPTDFDNYKVGEAVDWSAATFKLNKQFKIANAVKSGTKENDYFNLAIKDLAEQFLILQDANVPVIFRPLHEAEGNGGLDGRGAWFWWAQDGAEDYKKLWKYLYNELTGTYGVHNLIWEQNLYAWSAESGQWYAGDEYVDMVGFDKYDTIYNRHDGLTSGPNEDCNSGVFWSLVDFTGNNKLVAMPENSTIPSVKNMTVEHANWLYFCTWYDDEQERFLSGDNYNNADTVKETYQSEYCLTLDEMPENLYSFNGTVTPPDPTKAPVTETESVTDSEDIVYGDADLDGDVTIADVTIVLSAAASPNNAKIKPQGRINADVYQRGDGISSLDAVSIQKFLAFIIKDLPESYM